MACIDNENTQKQIFIAGFAMPFQAKLDEGNRCVILTFAIDP